MYLVQFFEYNKNNYFNTSFEVVFDLTFYFGRVE